MDGNAERTDYACGSREAMMEGQAKGFYDGRHGDKQWIEWAYC